MNNLIIINDDLKDLNKPLIRVDIKTIIIHVGAAKKEHRSKACCVQNKKKNKINMLELGNEVKNKLYSILDENENSSSFEEILSDDNQLNIAYKLNSSESNDHCKCGSAICTCDSHSINVITKSNKEKEALFDMIDHLEYPTLR